MRLNNFTCLILIILISVIFVVLFYQFTSIPYLTFSDGAKYADLARNLREGQGYGIKYTLFPNATLDPIRPHLFSAYWMSPLLPVAYMIMFFLFGVSDSVVILTSSMFFVLSAIFVYLLGLKLFGKLEGFLAALAFITHLAFLGYATSGATETLFTLEILLIAYLFLCRKLWTNALGFIGFIVIYLTRPHAPIYIGLLWLFYIFLNFKSSKDIFKRVGLGVIVFILVELFAFKFQGKFFLVSVLSRGAITSLHYSAIEPANSGLREYIRNPWLIIFSNISILIKKFLYNLYNFYKLLPEIISPYLFSLFAIGLVIKSKDNTVKVYKLFVLLMLIVVFAINAITIPLYRYLHPTVPFIYILSTSVLVWIVRTSLTKKSLLTVVSLSIIGLFTVGQTLGYIFLDSRYKGKLVNKGKPPVYVVLSKILRENSSENQTVVTNLDTWGSWYGQRRTIWYPLKPSQLAEENSDRVSFDAIYLTSYLIDDENYYMGLEWREVLLNPKNIKDKYIRDNYKFVKEFSVSADETYEKQSAQAVLLIRK